MKTYGLTGGIGAGKSTAADFLARQGWLVIDTDQLARQLVEPGQPALERIRLEFGPEALDPEGRLNRPWVAGRVFSDADARRQLEVILHPLIRDAWKTRLLRAAHAHWPAAVVVIPLLFETGAAAEFDATLCVGCSESVQRRRLAERGWTPAEINRRLEAQWPLRRKLELADCVVWNDASMEVLEAQLRRISP